MIEMTRRQLVAATAILATGGAGVTAVQGLEAASVSGQVDVQSERALRVTDASVLGGDAQFSRITDDNTGLQVAIEANNGDSFEVEPTVANDSSNPLAVRIVVATPEEIIVEDVDSSPDGDADGVVQSDESAYVTDLSLGETTLEFSFKIADVATPGAKDVTIDLEPLSTDANG